MKSSEIIGKIPTGLKRNKVFSRTALKLISFRIVLNIHFLVLQSFRVSTRSLLNFKIWGKNKQKVELRDTIVIYNKNKKGISLIFLFLFTSPGNLAISNIKPKLSFHVFNHQLIP